MTLLQGDRRCGCLLSLGLKKHKEGAQPTGFPRPHSCLGSFGSIMGQRAPKQGPPGCQGGKLSSGMSAVASARRGQPRTRLSIVKLLGLSQFFSPVPLLDGEAEIWGRQLGK